MCSPASLHETAYAAFTRTRIASLPIDQLMRTSAMTSPISHVHVHAPLRHEGLPLGAGYLVRRSLGEGG